MKIYLFLLFIAFLAFSVQINNKASADSQTYANWTSAAGSSAFIITSSSVQSYLPFILSGITSTLISVDSSGTVIAAPSSTARGNLGLGDSATLASSTWLKTANNLSELVNTSTARTNLGFISTTTASIGGAALTTGNCTSTTVTITGAATTTGSVVDASPQVYPGDGIFWKAYVSAANVVTVKACAVTSTTPTASKYNVKYTP